MTSQARKPRHRSHKHKNLKTSDAILAVAEDMCARLGPTNIKLADIAAQLGIETPSIYRHFDGHKGVIAGLARVALQAEIETFSGIERETFADAVRIQAERLMDLYLTRPGLARFLMVDLAVPGGLPGFEDKETLSLVRNIFSLEEMLFQKGLKEKSIRPMTLRMFVALRMGTAMTAIALQDLKKKISKREAADLKKEYVDTISTLTRP